MTTIDSNTLYRPHVNQRVIHEDEHRYRTIVAGRRFGKSALLINEGVQWLMHPWKRNQMIWLILPEYKQAKSIYWIDPDLSHFFLPYVQSGKLKKNDSDLALFCPETNSRLILKGADNADSLRGSGLDLIMWDEVDDIKQEAFNIVNPALVDSPNHKVIYAGTPDGYAKLHDLALMGDRQGIIERAGKDITIDADYSTYKFTSYDNMTWAKGTVERQAFVDNINRERKKYYEMGQGDWFEQEYMAEFRKRAGAVHQMFSREVHLLEDMQLPTEWHRGRGWDWGSSHPTASLRIAIDGDDNWFVERAYKKKGLTIGQHAANVKAQDSDFVNSSGQDSIPGYGDPSGKQWIMELNKLGFSIKAATHKSNTDKKTSLEFSIDKINAKLAPKEGHTVFLPNGNRLDNAPSFFILNREENIDLVDELETLTYKKTADGLQKTELEDTTDRAGHFDLHASLRYFAVSQDSGIAYKAIDPMQVVRAKAQAVDLTDETQRKQAELEADLAIMRAQQQNW